MASGGAEGESKIIKEARAKLNASLSIDDPTKIKAVLEDSEEFGDVVEIERKPLREKYDELIKKAQEHMKEVASGGDFAEMLETMAKYEVYNFSKTDKYDSGQEAFTELRTQWDTVLEATKEKLRALMSEMDPRKIDEGLEEYEYTYGTTIESEVKALQERKQKLFRSAGTEMQALAAKQDATVEQFDALLEKYKDWGEEVRTAREMLMSAHRQRLADIAREAGELMKSKDFKAVEEMLAQFDGTMEKHMKDKKADLTRHKESLVTAMKDRLQKAGNLEEPAAIDVVLKDAEPYGEAVASERQSLQKAFDDVISKANSQMSELLKADYTQFKEMTDTMAKYESYPGDETQKLWAELQKHWDEVLESTKQTLRDMVATTDPNKITEEMQKYESFESTIDEERATLQKRRTQLLDDCKTEMSAITAKVAPRVPDINACLEKFKDFPEEINSVRDQLRNKKAQVLTDVMDQLQFGQTSDAVMEVDKILRACEHAQEEEETKQPYEDLVNYRKNMKDAFGEKMLSGAQEFKDPGRLMRLISDSAQYGESIESERGKVQDALKSVLDEAVKEMDGLSSSEDFGAITAARRKYAAYPDGEPRRTPDGADKMDVKEAKAKLQARYDEVLQKTKASLRELSSSSDPTAIDARLKELEVYKDTIADERELVSRRRADLIHSAKQELQVMQANRTATRENITALLKKYEAWPADLRKEKDALRSKISMLMVGATDALNKAATSMDVEEIDRVLAMPDLTGDISADLKEAVEKVNSQRKTLADAMVAKMKDTQSNDQTKNDPKVLAAVLEESKKFGKSIDSDRDSMKSYIEGLFKGAKEEMATLVKEGEFKDVDDAVGKYNQWPTGIEDDLGKLRARREQMLDVAKSGLLDACALSDPIKIRDVLREHEKFGPAVERDREQVMRRIETIHDIAAKEMIEMASRKVVTETESSALLEKYAEWGSDPVHAELKKARDALRSKQAFLATGTMDRLRRLGAVEEDPAVLNQAIEEFKDRAEELGDAYVAITSRRDQLKDEVIAKINDAKALDDPVAMTRIITESEPFGELVERDRNGLKEDVQKLYKSVAGELEKLATATEVDFVQVELQCEKYKQWPEEHQTGIKDALAKLDKKRDELVTVAKDKILQLCGEADPVAIANGLVEFEDYGPSLDEQRRTAVTRRQFLIAEAQRTIRNLSTNKNATLAEMEACLDKYRDYPDQDVGTERLALERAKNRMHSREADALAELRQHGDGPPDIEAIDAALKRYAEREEAAKGARTSGEDADSKLPELPLDLMKEVEALQAYRKKLEDDEKQRLTDALSLEDPRDIAKVILSAEMLGAQGREDPKENPWKEFEDLNKHVEKLYTDAKEIMKKLSEAKEEVDFTAVNESLQKYEKWPPEQFAEELKDFRKRRDELVVEAKGRLLKLVEMDDPTQIQNELDQLVSYGEAVAPERDAATQRREDILGLAMRNMETLAANPQATVVEIQKMERKYADFGPEVRTARDMLRATGRRVLTASKDRFAVLVLGEDVKQIDAWIKLHTAEPTSAAAGDQAGAEADSLVPKDLEEEMEKLKKRRDDLSESMKKRIEEATGAEQKDPKLVADIIDAAAAYGDSLATELGKAKEFLQKLGTDAVTEIEGKVSSDDLDEIVACIEMFSSGAHSKDVKAAVKKLEARRDELVGDKKTKLLELVSKNDPNEITKGLAEIFGVEEGSGASYKDSPAAKYVKIEIDAANARWQGLIDEAKRTITVLLHPDRNATLQEVKAMQARYKDYPEVAMRDKMDALKSKEVLLSSSLKDTLRGLVEGSDFKAIAQALAQRPETPAGAEADAKDAMAEFYEKLESRRDSLKQTMQEKLKQAESSEDPTEMQELLAAAKSDYGEAVESEAKSLRDTLDKMCQKANQEMTELATATPDKDKLMETFAKTEEALLKYEKWPKDTQESYAKLKEAKNTIIDKAKDELLHLCGSSNPVEITEKLPAFEALGRVVDQEYAAAMARRRKLAQNANEDMQKLAMNSDAAVPDIEAMIAKYEAMFPEGDHDCRKDILQSTTLLRTVITNRAASASDRIVQLTRSEDIRAIDKMLKENEGSEQVKEALESLTKHREELFGKLRDEISAVTEEEDLAKMIATLVKGELFGESAEKEVGGLAEKITGRYKDALSEAKEVSEKEDDPTKVAQTINRYEHWPRDDVPASIKDAVAELHKNLDGLRERRDQLLGDVKVKLMEVATSEDIVAIDEMLETTEPLAAQATVERRAAQSRREALVSRAKAEMGALSRKSNASALEIFRAMEKYRPYKPEDVRAERDALKAKQTLVFAETKDSILRIIESREKDVRVIDKALNDPYDGYTILNPDGTPSEESVLKEVLEKLAEYKEQLKGGVKERLAQYEKIDTVAELQALLDETQGSREGLETERKAVQDKLSKIWDEANVEMTALCKSHDFNEIEDGLKKYESFGGPTEARWNSLNLHREEMVDSVKIHLIELMKSTDALEIAAALEQYESYSDAILGEKDALRDRQKALYNQAVSEMQTFAARSDVSYADVQSMIDKYAGYPREHVRLGQDALTLKMKQLHASVGDQLSFLLETKDIVAINETLREVEGLGDEIREDREKLEAHKKALQEDMSKRLVAGVQLESPKEMQRLLDEAQAYGEEIKTESRELKRKLDIVVATAQNDMKALMASEDFRAMSQAVKTYEGFHADTQGDWEALRSRWRREAGNAKSRLQRVATSNDPNEIIQVVESFASAESILAEELAQGRERYTQLIEMANTDMLALARSPEPTIKEIERILYRYDKYPMEIEDSRLLLKKKSDQIAQSIEAKIDALAASDDLNQVTKALTEYGDAGDRFVHSLAALKKRRNELLDEIGSKFKAVMNADNPMQIEEVLDEIAIDTGEDLRVERAALVKRKRELIEHANEKMQLLMSSEDFPAISAAIDAYESWGEATATAWTRLREHWIGQLDQVKKNLRDLCSETQPTVIDNFLKKLDGMDPDMLSRIESEMQAAQARRESLIESATDKIRSLSADDRASILKIEEALQKYASYPGMEAALSGLEGAKEQAIARGQEELKVMMESEDVAEIDKMIAKHKRESGSHLDDLVEDVVDRRRTLLQRLFDQIDEVSYSEQVSKMAELIIAAEEFGADATEQLAFMQRRREEVIATVIRTLQMLSRSNDFGAIAAAMQKYEDFSPETTSAYEAVKDRWDGLVEMAKTQLEALAMNDNPAQIAAGLKTYEAWGGDLESAKDNAIRRLTDLLEQAKENIAEICENPDVAIKDVEDAIMKYAAYPDIDAENAALAMHLSKRVAVVQDQLAILRESDDISKVSAGLAQHKGSSERIETAVRDLEHHMVGLGRRMADRLQRLLKTQDLGAIDRAIADSAVYGETVEEARDKLSDHRRKILRLAAEEIAELTLSDDFLAVKNALFKYKDWPEETQQHVERLENHRKLLIDGVKTSLSGLRSAVSIQEIDSELARFEPYGQEIAEEFEAAERRKEELFEDASKEMEALAKDDSKDIVQIEEMIAKYESYPNDVRRARDQLKTELAKLVAKVREELRSVVKSNDFKAVAQQLDKYAKTPSAQIAGVVAELRQRQDNLVVVFCQELEKGKSLQSPVQIDELLEKAKAYEGMPGIKQGTKALQERRVIQMRACRQHIKKMSRSDNFREISEAVELYANYPEDIKVEWEILQSYRDQLAEEARARLKELVSSEDPSYLQFELEKYEAFGDLLVNEVDEVQDRKSELIKMALEQLETIMADEATDMKVIGEKLIEYGSYPGIDTMRMKLQTKLDDLVASGKAEIIKAMDSNDVELVSKVLEKHESSGEYLDAALQTLEQHRDRLESKVIGRLADTMSEQDLVKVKAELQKVEQLKGNPAFASMISEVQTYFDSLRQEAIAKLDEALSREKPKDVASLLLDTTLAEVDEDIRVKFDDLRARYIELTDLARDKLVSALGEESPEQMKQALDDTTEFKVELEHERKSVAERRASLIDGVQKELRAIGMQNDFKALGEALEKYKNYAPETQRDWNALQRRNEDLIENAKKSLRDLQGSKDPGYIDDQVRIFEQFGEVVDPERTAALARRNELIEGAKSEMQALAGADVTSNVKKIADALNRFRMFPDEADSDRKVLDEMLRSVVKEHDELLRHALRSDDVQEVDNALAKCRAVGLDEYLGQAIEDTTRYRFKLEQQMGAKVRLAIQGKDLKLMTDTLTALENFGDKLETERIALQSHYKTTQAAIKKDLRERCLSQDYAAVSATLRLYTEPYPVELESEIRKLHQHQENLLQSAKDQLIELVAAATPMHIDEQLPKFASFGPELDGERAGARTRRADLCERASKDMEALADPNSTATLRELELCLEQHELYPKEVRGARDALKTRKAVKTAKLRERIRDARISQDFALVSGLLEEISDTAGVQLAGDVADLKEHQSSMVETIKNKMKAALQYEDPRDLDKVIEEANQFGGRVKSELALLARRKANLIDGINKQLKKLTQIDDVDAITIALQKYKDFSDETDAEWQSLQAHREALVERARAALREMTKSPKPAEILACMERYSTLDDLVADEKEQAQARYFELMDEARLALTDAIHAKTVDIPRMSEIVARYEAWPQEINDLRQQLRGKITRAVNQGADAIMNALHTKDITAIDACLGSFGGSHGNFQDQLSDLKTHRDRLVRDMVAKLSSAVSMSDPHFIRQVLKEAEPYGAEVDTERKMLEDRRESLRDAAVADMDAAIASDDFKQVSLLLKKYSSFADELPVQFENLRQTYEDIIEIAKAGARDLLSATDPREIDAQMKSLEYYGEVLAPERQALNEARFDIVQEIKKELLATTDDTIEEIERVLEKYADFSAEDIGRERRRLEAALQAKIALMEERMGQLRRTRDISAVDLALADFAPYESRLEDSFLELRRHRERLLERICENLMSAVDLEDPKRIMEVLEESKPFEKEVEKERNVLRERYETLTRRVNDKLELLLQTDDYPAVTLALKQQDGHSEALASTVRALQVHADELVSRCKTELKEVCARTDLPQDQLVVEIARVIQESRVFKDEVKDLRVEAEIKLDELYEIAATDMDSWSHDMSAAPWLLSEILQKYPSSAYPTDERVVRARNALQERLAATITALSETMYSLASSTNVAAIDTLLLTHRKDSELVPEAYRELQTHRQKLTTSLHTRIKSALVGEDIWVVSRLISEATDAGLVQEKAALEEKRGSIIEGAARTLSELKSLDDYPVIAAAVKKYSEYPHDVGQALVDLQEHARNLVKEARSFLRERAQREVDPTALTDIIEKYEVFGDEVDEQLHACRVRRVNLIEAARRELHSMKYRQGLTIADAEHALEKYEAFGDSEFKAEMDGLHERIAQMVNGVADAAARTKYTGNIQIVEAALIKNEQLLSKYMPSVLADLRGFKAEMVSNMRTEVQAAMDSEDPRIMNDRLAKLHEQGFQDEGKPELENLERKMNSANQLIEEEIKLMMQSEDYPDVLALIEKYENRGHCDQINESVDALKAHRDTLRRTAARRIREKTAAAENPKDLAEVIKAHADYREACMEQLAEAEARRMTLFQDAKTKMQLLLQDPHASIEQMTKVYNMFADFTFEVRNERTNLKLKIERVTADTEKQLRDATTLKDVDAVEALLAAHEVSRDALEPAYGMLVHHRLELTRRLQKNMVQAASQATDPWEIDRLLQEAVPHGQDVEQEKTALKARYEVLIDQAIDDMHSLVEQDENFREIYEAVRKYEHYPRVCRSAWQALRQHQKILINAAKQELQNAAKSTDVDFIAQTVAKFDDYGDDIEVLAEIARERGNYLYQEAEDAMSRLLHAGSDDTSKIASTRQISEALQKYSEYKSPRVDEMRKKLHDILGRQLRSADLQLRDVMRTEDVHAVDVLLRQYADHGEELSHVIDEVKAHRETLKMKMKQQLTMAAASDDPRKLWATIQASRQFGDDLSAPRSVVTQRYSMIVENVIRHIKTLTRSEDYSSVVNALEKYKDYPAQEFKLSLDSLRNHHEDLVAAAKGELGRLTRSDSPLQIDSALTRFSTYGAEISSEMQTLRAARRQLIEAARREMSTLAAAKSSTTPQIEAALEKYAKYPVELNDVRRVLIERLESTRTVKQQLLSHRTAVEPGFILREVQRHEIYGPAVEEERAVLQKRVVEITEAARIEMENLVRDPHATVITIERALDKYGSYPDSLTDIRAALSAKFDQMLSAMRKEVNRTVGGADIHKLNGMMQQFSGTTNLARDLVSDLEQQRLKLGDELVSRMKDALLSPDPVAIADLMEESMAYGDNGDVVAFRRGLVERHRALLDAASDELHAARESTDYTRVDATLRRFENYPPEIKPIWVELDAHRNRLVRDVVRDAQSAMQSTSTQAIDATLNQLNTFGDKFVAYKHLLHSRRTKVLADSQKVMQQALVSNDIMEVDRICSAHVHLVGEIDGSVWKQLRDHRQNLIVGLKQQVQSLLQKQSLVELDAQLELISVDGLRQELYEEIEQLRDHRQYLLQEADASLGSARQAGTSRNFAVISEELEKLIGFGFGERPEAIELAQRKEKLIAIAKKEMAAAASSSNAHLIKATLDRFVTYGPSVATERHALAVCLQRLEASAREKIEQAGRDGTAASMKAALVQSETFHAALASERDELSSKLQELQQRQQEELAGALRSEDMRQVVEVVKTHAGSCTEELTSLYAQVEERMETKLTEMREHLLEGLGWTKAEQIDKVAQVLANYRGQVSGLEDLDADWDALEGHYRRLMLGGKKELTKLLQETDPMMVETRLTAFSGVKHFAPELRRARLHSRTLLRDAAEELVALADGIDVVAINAALKKYAPVEGALQPQMDALRSRRSQLAQRASDRNRVQGALGGVPDDRPVVAEDGRVLHGASAQQELSLLLSATDLEAVEAALARYPDSVARRLGGGVPSAVQKLRTHYAILQAQAGFGGGATAVQQGYTQLRGAEDRLAQLEAERSTLSARVAKVAHEAKMFEEQAEEAAAVSNVLELRVQELREAAAGLDVGARLTVPSAAGSMVGVRRCPACCKMVAAGAEFREHAQRCIHQAVDFSVRRALGSNPPQRSRARREHNIVL